MSDDFVNIHEAKTHLSRLIERVRQGATITLAKAGTPVARLVPLEPASPRTPGGHEFTLGEEFFEPLPESDLEAWSQ